MKSKKQETPVKNRRLDRYVNGLYTNITETLYIPSCFNIDINILGLAIHYVLFHCAGEILDAFGRPLGRLGDRNSSPCFNIEINTLGLAILCVLSHPAQRTLDASGRPLVRLHRILQLFINHHASTYKLIS